MSLRPAAPPAITMMFTQGAVLTGCGGAPAENGHSHQRLLALELRGPLPFPFQ